MINYRYIYYLKWFLKPLLLEVLIMFQLKIVTDGAADIPLAEAAEKDIKVVPFYVSFDGKDYKKELEELSLDEFYSKIINEKLYPKTSLPSVSDYADVFEQAVSEGSDVLCFTITNTLSGSFQSALSAKEIVEEKYPNSNIYVVNSFHATGSQLLLIHEAVKMRDAGLSVKEAYDLCEKTKNNAGIIFMVGNLDHLAKGGRIGRLVSISGTLLKIKPLIQLQNGYIDTAGIVRSRKAGLKKLAELTNAFFKKEGRNVEDYIFTVGTTNTLEEAEPLRNELKALMPDIEFSPLHFQIGATIATHTGPDTIGVCFAEKFKK